MLLACRTHALCQFAEQRLKATSAAPSVVTEPDLTYPTHPFSPQLCTDIAALPLGLSDVVLEGTISEQIIEVLCRLSKMSQETPLEKHATTQQIYNISIDIMSYFTRVSMTPLERSICLFCFIFIMRETPSRNESQWFYGQFLDNLRRRVKKISRLFMTLDGVNADLAIWGVAMFAMENSGEKFGLDENERSEVFEELIRRHNVAANWKQTSKCVKRFFFVDDWMEEYQIWWTKEMDKYKKRPRESQ